MQAVLKTEASDREPPFLVCNNPKAEGLSKAQKLGYEVLTLNSPLNYDQLATTLQAQGVTHIFLLGYMKILPLTFLQIWPDRIYNLHPSLLPNYPGLDSIERAYLKNDDIGISIHRVNEGVDQGEVLIQKCVFTAGSYKDMSLEDVKAFVHRWEHQMVTEFYLQHSSMLGGIHGKK